MPSTIKSLDNENEEKVKANQKSIKLALEGNEAEPTNAALILICGSAHD